MKVIKNNYTAIESTNDVDESYPRTLKCEMCESTLQYDKSDITIGLYGAAHIRCCLCGCSNMLEDEDNDIVLTKDNVEYPIHFYHTSKEFGAVDLCNNKNVKKAINNAIEFFRNNKDEYCWLTTTGNLCVFVTKLDDDKEYSIWVTNDYYSTYIPFESEDY